MIYSGKFTERTVFYFFASLALFGFFFSKDYGISWDEPIERINGLHSWASVYYFFTGNSLGLDLSHWTDRYYGNGLQHLLLLADYLGNCFSFHPDGNAQSWLLRHRLTFFFILTGLFFMYRTGRLLWRNKFKALLPVILFLFIPRFVAESFYNIKDMGFLAGMMFGGYFMVRYALHNTCINALNLGAAAAFVCSIRLAGLQLFAAGIFLAIFADLLCNGKGDGRKTLLHISCLLLSFSMCLILCYPACWNTDLLEFFPNAISYMAKHPWGGTVRFCGKDYMSTCTPWYYLIVWIGITTPLPVLFLLFIGSASVLKKSFPFSKGILFRRTTIILLMFFMMFWGELLLLPFVVKNYYNGWRHFYFLGYPMLILAGCGAGNLFKAAYKHKFLRTALISAIIIVSVLHISWMITQHPYQYMYFNAATVSPMDFELDYWHVSNTSGIRKILNRCTKKTETPQTLAFHDTIPAALSMFGDQAKEKIKIVSSDGFHDYTIIADDADWNIEKYRKQFPLKSGRKILSDETVWVKNSLGTKRIMVYRLVEFEKTPDAEIRPVIRRK